MNLDELALLFDRDKSVISRHIKNILSEELEKDEVIAKLIEIRYERNDIDFSRNKFRVGGDVLDIFPSDSSSNAVRIEFFGDEVDRICDFNPTTGEIVSQRNHVAIYPASHYVTSPEKREAAIASIEAELEERLKELNSENKLVEAQRLEQRTKYDIEMMRETGFCNGIENYSRHMSGRAAGTPPFTLIDYLPKDFLLMVDECHVTLPQVRAMFAGDRSRKESLVNYGFRLPSAFDNRPLTFDEFYSKLNQAIFVSATPSDFEKEQSTRIVEQVIRPTGLLDPVVDVRPITGQTDDLYAEIVERVKKDERVLVTTLTKKMAERLTEYFEDMGIKVRYLHSDVHTIERMEIIRDLRLGVFDVLVGINLLREGLDIPEVSLVAILDADKEGFLRSETSLIQTIGRAARNAEGKVIMYADVITNSMRNAIDETNRRRKIQNEYNIAHGIVPKTIKKNVHEIIEATQTVGKGRVKEKSVENVQRTIAELTIEMKKAAELLQFELAAQIRDEIRRLEDKQDE